MTNPRPFTRTAAKPRDKSRRQFHRRTEYGPVPVSPTINLLLNIIHTLKKALKP